MKNSKFIIAAASLLAVACSPDMTALTIKGTVADSLAALEGAQVIIRMGEKLDTIALSGTSFEYKDTADQNVIGSIMLDYQGRGRNASYSQTFIPEGGKTIKVVLADSSYVNGSPLTDRLNDYYNALNDASAPLMEEYKAAMAAGDESAADEIIERYNAAAKEISIPVFKENTDNAVSYAALGRIIYDLPLDELEELFAIAGPAVTENKSMNRQLDSKRAEAQTKEGKPFVDFAAKTLDGLEVKLSDYVGKGDYVLIDFWASWCGPCMRSMPELRATFDKYAKKGLKVIGVNVWERDPEACAKCVKDKNMTWTIIVADDNSATDSYGVSGIPTAIIFAPDGTIVKRGHPMEIKPAEFFAEIYK